MIGGNGNSQQVSRVNLSKKGVHTGRTSYSVIVAKGVCGTSSKLLRRKKVPANFSQKT